MLDRDFEQIEILKDAAADCVACIAIHSTRLGPAFGGIRRWAYPSTADALSDVLDLARAMTLKCAIAGVPGGGGKAVLVDTPGLDRGAGYRLLGRAVQRLAGRFYTGPDVGTTADDLEEVARETGYVARAGAEGPGNLAGPTALGVYAGIRAVARRLGLDALDGVTVAIQGLGEVGFRLAERLRGAGAHLVVADLHASAAERAADELDAAVVDVDRIAAAACDIFAPCALGGVIDDASVSALRARAVAGAANNVLAEPRHGAALAARGILFAPDFVINAGALIHGALFHLDGAAPPSSRVEAIGDVLGEILDRAAFEGELPEVLAERMALERVHAAKRRES